MAIAELTMLGYGDDFGNTETCGVVMSGNKSVFRSIPSASAQGSLKDLRNLGVDIQDDYYVYSDATTSGLYIGRVAIEQAYESFSGRNDDARYESVHHLRALLTCSSSMIRAKRYGLNVVTGIPVGLYIEDETIRTRISTALNGEHVFSINGVERVARINVDRVIMEGAAALRPYGIRDKQVPQAVIDIGGGTTDIIGAVGLSYQRHLCDNKQLGVETVMELLIANFKATHNGYRLNRMDSRNILRAYVSQGNVLFPLIYVEGKEISIEELSRFVKEALQEVGARIISFIKSTWKDEVKRFAVFF